MSAQGSSPVLLDLDTKFCVQTLFYFFFFKGGGRDIIKPIHHCIWVARWKRCGLCVVCVGEHLLTEGAVLQLQCSVCTGCGVQTASLEKGLRCWERVTCIPWGICMWPTPTLHAQASLSTSGRQLCGPVSHGRRGLFQDRVIKWGNSPLQKRQPGTPCPAPPGTAVY